MLTFSPCYYETDNFLTELCLNLLLIFNLLFYLKLLEDGSTLMLLTSNGVPVEQQLLYIPQKGGKFKM